MSDFRNVLKAGLMVSASLLAVGCSDDNKENTNTGSPSTGSPSTGSPSTGGGTVAPQPFAAVDPVKVIQGLESEKIALAQIDATAKPVNDILDMSKALHLKGETGSDAAKVAAAVAVIDPQEKVTYAFGDGQRLKGVISGAKDKTHHGKFTANKTLTTDLVFMEHATVAATGGDATWTVKTAHIGDDVVVGSDDIAQKKTSNSTKKLELSGGKKTTKHTSSKLHDHKASAKKTVKTKPEAHKAGKLTLKTAAVTAAEETQFDKAGMAAYGTLGSVELGAALVHDLELDNAVLTAVAPASGFLVLEPDQDKDTEHLTHHKAGSSTASKHPKGAKRKLALEGGKSKPKTSKSKKHPQAKSMHDNKVAEKKKTVGTTAQTLVDQGTGKEHHFMFQMDPKEKHAEVSDLKVGQNAQIQLLKNHPLVVHDINMNGNNLGLRVFAEKGDFHAVKDKAIAWTDVTAVDAADRWKADGKGQALIDKMKTSVEFKDTDGKDKSPISASSIVQKDKSNTTEKEYEHFDDHENFMMYLVGENSKFNGKKIMLEALDIGSADTFEAGTHFVPLIKDFHGVVPVADGATGITLAVPKDAPAHFEPHTSLQIKRWAITNNGFADVFLFVDIEKKTTALAAGIIGNTLMASDAQDGRSVLTSTLDAVSARLDPTNIVATSFANLSTARINQAAQVASLTRGTTGADSVSMGAVNQYNVSFDHNGAKFGFTYTSEGGNAFAGAKGATTLASNVATNLGGLTAVTSFEASADSGQTGLVSASHASYQAAVTFAKAYNAGGLSVVPMAGLGVASASLNDYSAAVPLAGGMLGLNVDTASFAAATFHAGVNFALDSFVAETSGVNASLALGVAGFLGSQVNATLHTSEGRSADLQFNGRTAAPYAQFNLGFASGESMNAMISTGSAAVSFAVDRNSR